MLNKLNYVEQNISLKEKTYFKMGGIAQFFATPGSLPEIIELIHLAKHNHLPIAVLGEGSNCVFSDEMFDGVVLSLQKFSKWWWESETVLFAESGVTNTDIANICLEKERKNASWMYRMPGQIGASVRMNARCYNGEISQIATEILTIDTNGHLHAYCAQDVFKGYKNTYFMHTPEIIIGVRFSFPEKESREKLQAHMTFCEDNRNSKFHFLYPSCGSTFKNNYEYGKPSGQIFDELGLKGVARGDSEISVHHGNFIWNKNRSQTADMLALSAFMRKEAREKLNVELNLEVQPIGAFTPEQFKSCGMEHSGPYIQQNETYLTGFFYEPRLQNNETIFPKCIFSSFFTEYFCAVQKNVLDVCVKILQLRSFENAQKNEHAPFLKWVTICGADYKTVFPFVPPHHATHALWEYSVSEIFFSHPTLPFYLECEITPSGEFLMLEFEDIRKQKNNTESLKPLNCMPASKNSENRFEFGLELSFAQLKHLIFNQTIRLQCALSLGNQKYFLAPYWTAQIDKPDFHQPSLFLNVHLL